MYLKLVAEIITVLFKVFLSFGAYNRMGEVPLRYT